MVVICRGSVLLQGLLDLEGDITPILVSLVRKDESVNKLLDQTHTASQEVT